MHKWAEKCTGISLKQLAFILLGTISLQQTASQNLSESPLSLNYQQDSLSVVFSDLSRITGWYFTYETDRLPADSLITLTCTDCSLKNVLDRLLQNSGLTYTTIDNHIVFYHKEEIAKLPEKVQIQKNITVWGTITDGQNGQALPFATVSVYGKAKGTITNEKGEFRISMPPTYYKDSITFSYIGYQSKMRPIDSLKERNNRIQLEREFVSIQEIIIRHMDPLELIRRAMENVRKNYSTEPSRLTAFYREGVKKRNEYQAFSEAVLDIYKGSYTRSWQGDQVKMIKSRKLINADSKDTLLLKLKAGLNASLSLDGIKNTFNFLSEENFRYYNYQMVDIQLMDGEEVYVVAFEQRPGVQDPLFVGRIYIRQADYAIVFMQFSLNPEKISKARDQFVVSTARRYVIKPKEATYSIRYREYNGTFYLHHVRGDLKFSVRKRRKWFSSPFSIYFEMAVNNIDTANVQRFPLRETISPRTVFTDQVYEYDPSFWGRDNYIIPGEKLEKALGKIRSSLEEYLKNRRY